jgi:hypothetical protein
MPLIRVGLVQVNLSSCHDTEFVIEEPIMCHRSALPRHILMFFISSFTSQIPTVLILQVRMTMHSRIVGRNIGPTPRLDVLNQQANCTQFFSSF